MTEIIIQDPASGPNLQMIHLEISRCLRDDEGAREILAQILAKLAMEFPKQYPF